MAIRALDVLDVLECPHRVFLNHNGDPALKSPITHFMELLQENGVKHEKEVIRDFEYETALGDDFPSLVEATRQMMGRGVRVIYQGALIRDDLVGRPDLLVRADGRSNLGNFFYFPIEIKNASGYEDRQRQKRKKKYGLQLAYYVRLLESAQGVLPPEGKVIDLNKEVVVFPIQEYLPELDAVLPIVRRLALGEERDEPALIGECANCQWRQPCRAWMEANSDIALLPGISRSHKEKLGTLGIRKMTDPLSWDRNRVVQLRGIGPASIEKWERQAQVLQSATITVLQRSALPVGELEVFFDVENDPTQDLVYLLGLGMLGRGAEFVYRPIWADNRAQEEEAWREFLAFIGGILDRNPAVYHYSSHERTMLGSLRQRYDFTPLGFVEKLESKMRDLHRLTVDSVVLPVRGYGLKELARFRGFQYTDPESGGAESIYWFNQYQDDPVANAAYKERLLQYNKEDCLALSRVLDFLRSL